MIVELVIQHTSAQHPWFQAARRDPPVAVAAVLSVGRSAAGKRRSSHVSRR
ncbi:Trehalose synthase [Klebsiella pneumoniae IS46]|nr:Trehalose synthase [Klebsiella pneumoniae IS46]